LGAGRGGGGEVQGAAGGRARAGAQPPGRRLETRYELPRGEPPPQLADALRRLRGARLACVRQLNLDRVAALELERGGRRVEVVVEWVREGNMLVVEGGVVAAALRQREMRDRRVAAGEALRAAAAKGPRPPLRRALDAPPPGDPKRTAAAHLSRLVNAPGELVAEALYRCGVDPSTPPPPRSTGRWPGGPSASSKACT